MNRQDEKIAAWLDGMLDTDGAARMSERAATDEQVAQRALRLRHLDELVRAAVPQDDEIPDALLERLGLAPSSAAHSSAATVVSLADARRARQPQAAPAFPQPGRTRYGFWRIAAQVVLVAGLGLSATLWLGTHRASENPADYRALSDLGPAGNVAAPSANALVVFDAGTDAAQARSIAQAAGAQIIGSQTEAGAWKLAISAARRDAVLKDLRSDNRVTMAEPIDGSQP